MKKFIKSFSKNKKQTSTDAQKPQAKGIASSSAASVSVRSEPLHAYNLPAPQLSGAPAVLARPPPSPAKQQQQQQQQQPQQQQQQQEQHSTPPPQRTPSARPQAADAPSVTRLTENNVAAISPISPQVQSSRTPREPTATHSLSCSPRTLCWLVHTEECNVRCMMDISPLMQRPGGWDTQSRGWEVESRASSAATAPTGHIRMLGRSPGASSPPRAGSVASTQAYGGPARPPATGRQLSPDMCVCRQAPAAQAVRAQSLYPSRMPGCSHGSALRFGHLPIVSSVQMPVMVFAHLRASAS